MNISEKKLILAYSVITAPLLICAFALDPFGSLMLAAFAIGAPLSARQRAQRSNQTEV